MKFKPFLNLMIMLLLIGSSAFVFSPTKNAHISKTLKSLTSEERYFLEFFFRKIALHECFSYVLFGNKPIAFTSYYEDDVDLDPFFIDEMLSEKLFAKGAKIYRKYKHLFHSRNYILRLVDFPLGTSILIINKKNFLETFNKNEKAFKEVLGVSITGEILFNQMLTNDDYGEVINCHEGLLGTLLGFGKHNSWLFRQRSEIRQKMRKFDLSLKRWKSLQNDYHVIHQRFTSFVDYASNGRDKTVCSMISLPGFVVDIHHPETKDLKKTYLEDRKNIIKAYGKGNFLEVILRQLCS